MSNINELTAGPLADEGSKGLPVVAPVMWAAFTTDGDFADITEDVNFAERWDWLEGIEVRPLVYLKDAAAALAKRDAELSELRQQNKLLQDAGERVDDHYECIVNRLQAEMSELRTISDAASNALHAKCQEVVTLQAELTAMREQKPVGQASLINGYWEAQLFGYHGLQDRTKLYAAPAPAPSQVAAEVVQVLVPDNLDSHRCSWGRAFKRLIELEPQVFDPQAKGYGDREFWQHESKAMADMYCDLDRLRALLATSQGKA